MTKAQDIRQLIAEQAAGPGERYAMESVAEGLDRSLARDVPARPEFKARLRRQLMAQARRNQNPWFERPVVWGSTFGVAAAAAVLAVGLNMFQAGVPAQPGRAPSTGVPSAEVTPNLPKPVVPRLTHVLGDVPQPVIADEAIAAGARPESSAFDAARGLAVLQLTVSSDRQQLADMASRLGLTTVVQQVGKSFAVSQGDRLLSLASDGQVTYADRTVDDSGSARIAGPEVARVAARQFLETALLPVPDLQPSVTQTADRGYEVVFTPRIDGRPVVNGRTRVMVTQFGRVVQATAYAPSGQANQGPFDAVTTADAVATAQTGGGVFTGADLVWVRTATATDAVYLQPYWRVYGTNAQGAPVARYVPSLKR